MVYTYILRCADGSYYTGWTVDLEGRLAAHNAGTAAKYTRGRCPVSLVYWEEYDDPNQARRREWEIKQLARGAKEALIAAGRIKELSQEQPSR